MMRLTAKSRKKRLQTSCIDYRKAGGSGDRVIADFMIALHALSRADRLLTPDRGSTKVFFELALVNKENG